MLKQVLVAAALALASSTAITSSALAQQAELRAGHFIGSTKSLYRETFAEWVDRINGDGSTPVQITQVVGPESIDRDQWCNAVSSGLIDMAVVALSYCNNLVPISEGLNAETLPLATLRENGAYDFLREIYARDANAYFLGQYGWGGAHHLFTSKPVASIEDLRGQRMRSTPTLRRFYEKLGVEGQMMGLGDTYTALDRGVIDGFALPDNMIAPLGLNEVTTYRIDPGVFNPALMVLVNLDTWEGMSEEQRAYLGEMAVVLEDEIDVDFRERNEAMGDALVSELGMTDVVLEGEEAERLQQMAIDGVWEAIMEVAPEDGARLRELIN